MLIIINKPKNFNILDKNKLEEFNKSINPTKVLCDSCPFKDKCKNPKAIFYGHYPHKVLFLSLVGGKPIVKQMIIHIQRIIGKGCGKTSSIIPDNHIPFHQFLFSDAENIIRDYLNEKVSYPFFNDLPANYIRTFNIYNKIDIFINSIIKSRNNKNNLYPIPLINLLSPT